MCVCFGSDAVVRLQVVQTKEEEGEMRKKKSERRMKGERKKIEEKLDLKRCSNSN